MKVQQTIDAIKEAMKDTSIEIRVLVDNVKKLNGRIGVALIVEWNIEKPHYLQQLFVTDNDSDLFDIQRAANGALIEYASDLELEIMLDIVKSHIKNFY